MRNIFLIIVLSIMLYAPAVAVNVEVEALSDFSTDNPPETYRVKIVEPLVTKSWYVESGSILEGIVFVTDAKRLKRDATFSFVPTILITPGGDVLKVEKDHTGKYKKEINKGKLAKTIALTAGNFALKGLSIGYAAIEGLVKNEQGNRLKSSVVSVYESTPISYVKKGNSLVIKEGEHFFIKFKSDDDDENENNNDNNDGNIDENNKTDESKQDGV